MQSYPHREGSQSSSKQGKNAHHDQLNLSDNRNIGEYMLRSIDIENYIKDEEPSTQVLQQNN